MSEAMKVSDQLSKTEEMDFVTVVSVGSGDARSPRKDDLTENEISQSPIEKSNSGYVTVLQIGENEDTPQEVIEEVLVYRLPGERLGFGLKFEGGTKATEFVKRLFIQSCAPDSPASMVHCSWGKLTEGDELLNIDSLPVTSMTRIDCVRCLKDSNVVIKLLVRHEIHKENDKSLDNNQSSDRATEDLPLVISAEKKRTPPPPPPVPPRKIPRKMIKDNSVASVNSNSASSNNSTLVQHANENMVNGARNSRFQSPRSSGKFVHPKQSPEVSRHVYRDKCLSDNGNAGPPDAEVYLDLFSQESTCNLSESDDTGSSISTIIDRFSSFPTTTNSSFSGSLPSTPTSAKKRLDLANVLDSFEEDDLDAISKDNYLFSKLAPIQNDTEEIDFSNVTKNEFEIIPELCMKSNKPANEDTTPLQPPMSFQDAPLSYGNETVGPIEISENIFINEHELQTCILENHVIEIEDENRNCIKNINVNDNLSTVNKEKQYSQLQTLLMKNENPEIGNANEPDLPRLVQFVPKSNKNVADQDQFDTIDFVKFFLENEIRNANKEMFDTNKTSENVDISNTFSGIYNSELYNPTWNLSSQLTTIGEDDEEKYQENSGQKSLKTSAPIVIIENTDFNNKNLEAFDVKYLAESSKNAAENGNIENRDEEGFSLSSNSSLEICDTMEVPPNGSRQPPDGDEFPDYHENSTSVDISKTDNFPPNESHSNSPWNSAILWKPISSLHLYKDQQSSRSVRDKIAIFSNTFTKSSSSTSPKKVCKSTDDIFIATEREGLNKDCNKSGTFHNKVKRSASAACKSEIYPMHKTNVNPSNSNSVANATSRGSPDLTFTNARSRFSTDEKTNSREVTNLVPQIQLHARSKSLVDISSTESICTNKIHKKDRWNVLAEQRQKSLSKLKGLIIPERVVESDIPTVIDLPEIKSNDTPISNTINSAPTSFHEMPIAPCQRNVYTPSLSTPPWNVNNPSSVPKYSPAFKRKSLQIHSNGTIPFNTNSSVIVPALNDDSEMSSIKLNSKQHSLGNHEFNTESKIYGGLCLGDAPKSLESITSPTRSDCSFEYLNSSSPDVKSCKQESLHKVFQIDTRVGPYFLHKGKEDIGRSEDESDNDSAVSSSQSSYISRTSPPMSPNYFQGNFSSRICNITESDSGLQFKCHSTDSQAHAQLNDGQNHRLLKAQSVEAINRKNILASAKCRSGRDLKIGSPLIQRRFEEDASAGNHLAVQTNNKNLERNVTKYLSKHNVVYEISNDVPPKPDMDLAQTEIAPKKENCFTTNNNNGVTEKPVPSPRMFSSNSLKSERIVSNKTVKDKISVENIRENDLTNKQEKKVFIPKSLSNNACSANVTDLRKSFEKLAPVQTISHSPNTFLNKNSASNPTKSTEEIQKPNTSTSQKSVPKQQEESVKSIKPNPPEMVNEDVEIITLQPKIPGGTTGITLAGGADYETKEITVHKIREDSLAHTDGRLQKGDKIVSINGKCVDGLTHSKLVALLKEPLPEVTLGVCKRKKESQIVRADKNISSSVVSKLKDPVQTVNKPQGPTLLVKLVKDISGLGFSLEGGQDSLLGNMPLLIKKIFKGGAADKDGQLHVGDELLMVNETDISTMSRFEVWSILKKLPEGVGISLTIRR